MTHDYLIAFGCFWFGFLICAALVMGRERHASMVGTVGGTAEGEHCQGKRVVAPQPAEAVVVGDILEKKKVRVSRAKKNGEVTS
jgi:hypothetical protein